MPNQKIRVGKTPVSLTHVTFVSSREFFTALGVSVDVFDAVTSDDFHYGARIEEALCHAESLVGLICAEIESEEGSEKADAIFKRAIDALNRNGIRYFSI